MGDDSSTFTLKLGFFPSFRAMHPISCQTLLNDSTDIANSSWIKLHSVPSVLAILSWLQSHLSAFPYVPEATHIMSCRLTHPLQYCKFPQDRAHWLFSYISLILVQMCPRNAEYHFGGWLRIGQCLLNKWPFLLSSSRDTHSVFCLRNATRNGIWGNHCGSWLFSPVRAAHDSLRCHCCLSLL